MNFSSEVSLMKRRSQEYQSAPWIYSLDFIPINPIDVKPGAGFGSASQRSLQALAHEILLIIDRQRRLSTYSFQTNPKAVFKYLPKWGLSELSTKNISWE